MRDNINVNTSALLFESFKNFTGGLNVERSNDTLKDSETTILQNVNLLSNGSIRRREGFPLSLASGDVPNTMTSSVFGLSQGMFKFKFADNTFMLIIADGGRIYATSVKGEVPSGYSYTMADISQDNAVAGVAWTFQPYTPIDAVQYNDKMYIVTGDRIGVLSKDNTKTYKFKLEDLQATKINEYQATYAGYNLYDSSSDITNIFYSKSAYTDSRFNAKIFAKGVIDKSVNSVPSYTFYVDAKVAGAPASYVDTLGYSELNLSVNNSQTFAGTPASYLVVFEQSTTGAAGSWTSAQSTVGATGANAQGTFRFVIGTGGITQRYFRARISTLSSGYVSVHVQPRFLLRPPVAGDTVRFICLWEADTGTYDPTSYTYQFEIKKFDDTSYPTTAYIPYGSANYFDYTFDGYGQFDIRATIRHSGTVYSKPAILTPVIIAPEGVSSPLTTSSLADEIKKCRRCLIHWNRLIIYYGDTLNYAGSSAPAVPNRIYVSELDDFGYFPVSGYIDLITDAAQPVTSIVRHRNQLVIFTISQIYSMTGQAPTNFSLALINDAVGCDQSRSVVVVDTDVFFANASGVYALRPSQYILNNFNITQISKGITPQYLEDFYRTAASCKLVGVFFSDNYYLMHTPTYSDTGNATNSQVICYKFYTRTRSWARDLISPSKSTDTNTARVGVLGFVMHEDRLYTMFSTEKTGVIARRTDIGYTYDGIGVYSDLNGSVYTMKARTKFFDFSASFNRKKLKRIYLLAKTNDGESSASVRDIDLYVTVEADGAEILDPSVGSVQIVGGYATWVVNSVPNFTFQLGTELGQWVLSVDPIGTIPISCEYVNIRGKARRIRLTIEHSEAVPCEIVSAGFQFRLKKP